MTDVIGPMMTQFNQIDYSMIATNFVNSLISVFFFILVAIIGYIIAKITGWLWKYAAGKIKLEHFMKQHGLHDALLGWTLTGIIKFILELWIFMLFLGWAAQMSGFLFLTANIQGIINYIPGLVKGLTILVIAMLVGDYITDRIKASKVTPFAKPIGTLVEVVIVYIGVVMALPLVLPGANTIILESTFMTAVNAFFAAIAIAIGLGGAIAIGLGTKDTVRVVAKKKQKDLEKLI